MKLRDYSDFEAFNGLRAAMGAALVADLSPMVIAPLRMRVQEKPKRPVAEVAVSSSVAAEATNATEATEATEVKEGKALLPSTNEPAADIDRNHPHVVTVIQPATEIVVAPVAEGVAPALATIVPVRRQDIDAVRATRYRAAKRVAVPVGNAPVKRTKVSFSARILALKAQLFGARHTPDVTHISPLPKRFRAPSLHGAAAASDMRAMVLNVGMVLVGACIVGAVLFYLMSVVTRPVVQVAATTMRSAPQDQAPVERLESVASVASVESVESVAPVALPMSGGAGVLSVSNGVLAGALPARDAQTPPVLQALMDRPVVYEKPHATTAKPSRRRLLDAKTAGQVAPELLKLGVTADELVRPVRNAVRVGRVHRSPARAGRRAVAPTRRGSRRHYQRHYISKRNR